MKSRVIACMIALVLTTTNVSVLADTRASKDTTSNNIILDIYVTSNEDLVNEEGNLEIGKINVNGNVGDNFNVSLNENKKSIKLVTKNINNEEAYKPEDNTEEVSNPEKVEEISTPNNKQEITNEVMEDSNDNLVLENVELDNNNSKTGDNSLIRIFLLIGCGISSMLVALITIYNKLSYKGKH